MKWIRTCCGKTGLRARLAHGRSGIACGLCRLSTDDSTVSSNVLASDPPPLFTDQERDDVGDFFRVTAHLGGVRLSSVRFSDRQHASYARASATNGD